MPRRSLVLVPPDGAPFDVVEDSASACVAAPDRVELLGIGLDRVTEVQAILRVIASLNEGEGGCVVTPNLDHLRQLVAEPELAELVASAELVVADGMPLLWASRLQRDPLPERVCGSSMIFTLSEAAAYAGKSVFLLGAPEGVGDEAGRRLQSRFPNLDLRGTFSPPFGFETSTEELERIVDMLREADADIVYCGFGFPKQERLTAYLRPLFPHTWFVCCGAAISMAAGEFERAPQWMQAIGLEWLHRLALEPRRLFGRYVKDGMPFAMKVGAQAFRSRRAAIVPPQT